MTDICNFIKKKTSKAKWQVLKFQASKCQEDPMNKSHYEICQNFLDICKISLLAMVSRDRQHEWETAELLCPKIMKERNYWGHSSGFPCPSAHRPLRENSDIPEIVTLSVLSSWAALLVGPRFLLKIILRGEAPDHKWRVSFSCGSVSTSVKVRMSESPKDKFQHTSSHSS